jgi:hypothetical protein
MTVLAIRINPIASLRGLSLTQEADGRGVFSAVTGSRGMSGVASQNSEVLNRMIYSHTYTWLLLVVFLINGPFLPRWRS